MTTLYVYDDALARGFEPFALTRPVSELRAGAELIRKRWASVVVGSVAAFAGAEHLSDFEEADAPRALAADATIPPGAIIANSRFVVALDETLRGTDSIWNCDGRTCAVRLAQPLPASALADGSQVLERLADNSRATGLRGRWLSATWDLLAHLSSQLMDDIPIMAARLDTLSEPAGILGPHQVAIERGASVEAYVIFDATAGPILIRKGATISAFTRLVGPCYVGPDTTIVGDRVANCSIGEKCKIRGEMSSTIVLGHSNKGHTGFVGHSYIGRWVNLGAGTTTSNLKNTYGTVHLWTPSGITDTGQQFLGTMFGDHVKTGIGTMLTTGTVLGTGANVFGAATHPKYVAPFSWGDGEPYATFHASKFLDVAERMMKRRGVQLGDALRRHLARAHARATGA
jgi:UDP-N-acetylglucosamine diphosphorylase / glucose-1-phosphate thymidylyltransferase / UDP-N-acetylgalactosamine diphosphorylase / glucosamine-1-phosphate N-acetyltransferase / galactosamine-1-phosphate N-acetyltransferase